MEVPRADRRPASRALLVVAAASAAATALCIALIDEPFARWNAQWEPSPIWDGGIAVLQWVTGIRAWRLASAVAVVVGMLLAVAVPRWRGAAPAWMFVAGTHLLVRLATIYIKEGTGQLRPTEWLAQGGDVWWRDGGIAFPSGDVTLVASLAIPAIALWPRARAVVAAMVAVIAFAMVARVATNAHFVGDVTGSVMVVAVVAWAVAYLVRPFRR